MEAPLCCIMFRKPYSVNILSKLRFFFSYDPEMISGHRKNLSLNNIFTEYISVDTRKYFQVYRLKQVREIPERNDMECFEV